MSKLFKRRALSLVLASLLFVVQAATSSCGSNQDNQKSDNTKTTTVNSGETPDETIEYSLPAKNFDGREFRIVTSDEYAYQICSEEATGEVTNDAIYNRNIMLEDKYNFKIVSIINGADKYKWYTPIINTVLAGDDSYDLVGHYAYSAHEVITQGMYKNWLEIPYIDISHPWWNQNINGNSTINGKLFAITGYLSMSVMQCTYAMFFNIDLAKNYGLTPESLYQTVEDNKWTIDYFNKITKNMYKDLDGDNKRSDADQYGYATMPDTAPDIWLAAFNQKLTSKNSDGTIKIEINTDKTVAALEKLLDFFYNNEGVINLETIMPYKSYYGDNYFADGKSVFVASCLSSAYNLYRDMKSDYGIITIPKWEDKQEKYFTHIMDKYTIWGVPVTETDDEFVGFITEALCEESYKSVYPAFYDVALKNKYSSDMKTAEMVDLLMEGVTFDFAFMFGDYCGKIQTMIREHIKNNDPNFASDYAKRIFKLDELFKAYE